MPGIRAIFRVVEQGLEERRLHALQITFGLPNDVAGHKLRRVFEHVDETMQFTQDVIGQMARGFGFAIDINRHVCVFAAHFVDEAAQVHHHRVQIGTRRKLFIVNRQNERAGPRLLLGKLTQVAVTGHAEHLRTLGLNRVGQGTDAQSRCVFRAKILVDDDDGKAKLHARLLSSRVRGGSNRREVYLHSTATI